MIEPTVRFAFTENNQVVEEAVEYIAVAASGQPKLSRELLVEESSAC